MKEPTKKEVCFSYTFNERNHLSKIVNSLNQYHNKNMYAINILQSEFLVQKSGCLFFFSCPSTQETGPFFFVVVYTCDILLT